MKKIILIISLMLIVFSISVFAETGLVNEYTFEEGSGDTLIDQNGTHSGTINGAFNYNTSSPCSFITSGDCGTYFGHWDGSGNIALNKPINVVTEDFSVSMWMRIYADYGTSGFWGDYSGVNNGIMFYDEDAISVMRFGIRPPTDYAEWINTDFYNGVWHHYVFTWNKTNEYSRLYVNGIYIDDDVVWESPDNIAVTPTLGGYLAKGNMQGDMDEFKLYNIVLSPAQVVNLTNYGNVDGYIPPLVLNSSSIDLLFKNSTSAYKILFDESEDIEIYINYTDDETLISLNDSFGVCNITVVGGILEEIGTEDNFELCDNALCDNVTYSFSSTFHSNDSYLQDFIRVEICHSQVALGDMIANISCGDNIYSELITASQIPLCNGEFGEVFIYSASCSNYLNVNVSLSFTGSYQRRKLINIIELDREFIEHFNNASFNSTSQLWYINHTHEYYTHGSKNIYANCSYLTDTNFNNSVSENITIVNRFPQIFIQQINNALGIFNLTDNIVLEYSSGIWNWLISILDNDIDTINYTFTNSSGDVLYSIQTNTPIIFNSSDALFVDFNGNPYNLSVWVNDSFNNMTNKTLLFNITDTGFPTYDGFDNTTIGVNTIYSWNANGYDEYLWNFIISCNNSFKFEEIEIGETSYNFVNQTNITGDTLCNFNWSDGHTGILINDFSLSSSVNSFTFEGITIQSEKPLKNVEFIKEKDKYKVCLETTEIESFLYLTMPKECIKYPSTDYKGWYVCDNKYWFDTESIENYPVWTDGDKIITIDIRTAKSKVICLDSIGILNRVSGSQLITASLLPPPPPVLTLADRLAVTNTLLLFALFTFIWVVLVILSSLTQNNIMMLITSLFGIIMGIGFINAFMGRTAFQNLMLLFIFVNIILIAVAGAKTGGFVDSE